MLRWRTRLAVWPVDREAGRSYPSGGGSRSLHLQVRCGALRSEVTPAVGAGRDLLVPGLGGGKSWGCSLGTSGAFRWVVSAIGAESKPGTGVPHAQGLSAQRLFLPETPF